MPVLFIFSGCTGNKKHATKFVFEIESTNGDQSLRMECFDSQELEGYVARLSTGDMQAKQPAPVASYDSKTKATNEMEVTLELPEKDTVCMLPTRKVITVHTADNKSGQVFKAKDKASIRVKYNMFTNKLYVSKTPSENVEIIK